MQNTRIEMRIDLRKQMSLCSFGSLRPRVIPDNCPLYFLISTEEFFSLSFSLSLGMVLTACAPFLNLKKLLNEIEPNNKSSACIFVKRVMF